jgi:hypothetical protein
MFLQNISCNDQNKMPKGNRTRNGIWKEEILLKRTGCQNSKLSK